MKVLLVTSAVTLVPNNYDDVILGLAQTPQVQGLMMLDNRDSKLIRTAFGLVALGARRFALNLLRNLLGRSLRRRKQVFGAHGKPVWLLSTINCPKAAQLVRDHAFELIVNARTRYIYRKEILSAPRLGCINVHHGLLPDQRGRMCDLWALSGRQPTGFTVHQMTPKVDAGGIVQRVQVADGSDMDYLAYLAKCARRERDVLQELLRRIESRGRLDTTPNNATPATVQRHVPTRNEMKQIIRQGVRL